MSVYGCEKMLPGLRIVNRALYGTEAWMLSPVGLVNHNGYKKVSCSHRQFGIHRDIYVRPLQRSANPVCMQTVQIDLTPSIQNSFMKQKIQAGFSTNYARSICTICICAGSVDICEGLTSISEQLILETLEVFIVETMYNLYIYCVDPLVAVLLLLNPCVTMYVCPLYYATA